MTPAARCASAIEITDKILFGQAAEQVLTNWARGHRFAGSSDRAAIRDLVYDGLRCQRSYAALGGAMTGRGIIMGGLIAQGADLADIFTGLGYSPTSITPHEGQGPALATLPPAVVFDCPDTLFSSLKESLKDDFELIMQAMQKRAPLYVRVNQSRFGITEVECALLEEGIEVTANNNVNYALEVTKNARKVQSSKAYLSGSIEIQDLSSQAVIALLPDTAAMRVLDYCAGGGGKSLALAARGAAAVFAHDANPRRMIDLIARAKRAGTPIKVLDTAALEGEGPFEMVLTDVPCSGSGAWRRDPENKWRQSIESLKEKTKVQAEILKNAARLVTTGGYLAYTTCSLLTCENEDQINAFLANNTDFSIKLQQSFSPLTGGDGFFLALMQKALVNETSVTIKASL
jgi:16S rRNA (cytosine967-C5)-methyltransferase